MIPRADLPDVLPLFPLPGALLLPRGRLPLNIFEPRYLAMFDDAIKTDGRLIGMIQPAVNSGERLHAIGCAGRITSFTETDDHRYMVQLTGVSRFRLKKELEGFAPYRRAELSWDGFERDLGRAEKDEAFQRDAFLSLLVRYFDVAELSTDWESLKEAEEELLINSLSMLCPFDPEDKQALLEAPSLTTRRETLVTLMEFALASGRGGTEGGLQ
ncbi:LON peptidase substrate-binding domain-containing protein [Maritimibacter dapengensis]|uniref:LON peptidase substrate-binding domain-containing protein n=1 Tax=Maritimibacter dapengensis TaxID=2836868 RepID=A0ABS6T4U2_9RHOB|nr:LON peptidase substrate-binding domain-containing protein [Maritimibacter dapengensis]MBV7380272.1 LON peptidase substrate-binding domain-containing protein [Maritimibacter dapengensis]